MTQGRVEITDALLVAYVDNELGAEDRTMIAKAAELDPSMARRMEAFRLSRDLLAEAFPLRPHTADPASEMHGALSRLADAAARRTQAHASGRPVWAIAASVIIGIAAVIAYIVISKGTAPATLTHTDPANIRPDSPLYTVLESAPSAKTIPLNKSGDTARVILTFKTRDGTFCRQFEIEMESSVSTALACRETNRWSSRIWLAGGEAPRNDASVGYRPAGGGEDRAMAVVIDRLIVGEPLSAAEELRLIQAHWTEAPRNPEP